MRALEILIRTAITVVLLGGGGTIAGLVMRSDTVRLPSMYVLLAGLAVTGAILAWATLIGIYHLFLYLFTNRRPLGFFATTSKDDPGGPLPTSSSGLGEEGSSGTNARRP